MKKIILLLILISQISIAEDNRKSYSVINVASDDVLNVREAPSSRSRVVGSFSPWEDNLIPDGCKAGTNWCRVEQYEGDVSGWVNKRFLKKHRKVHNQYGSNSCSVKNVSSNDVLFVRQYPSNKSKKMGFLKFNASGLIAYSKRGNWVFVTNRKGISGWANKRFLHIEW